MPPPPRSTPGRGGDERAGRETLATILHAGEAGAASCRRRPRPTAERRGGRGRAGADRRRTRRPPPPLAPPPPVARRLVADGLVALLVRRVGVDRRQLDLAALGPGDQRRVDVGDACLTASRWRTWPRPAPPRTTTWTTSETAQAGASDPLPPAPPLLLAAFGLRRRFGLRLGLGLRRRRPRRRRRPARRRGRRPRGRGAAGSRAGGAGPGRSAVSATSYEADADDGGRERAGP